jgi:ssDNA-binding Zn-finger/Zn-ribbon topoisomerase 1
MFDCPNCGKKALKLIIAKGPLGCTSCVDIRNERNPNLHQQSNPFVKMTYAEKMRIKTRTQGKDNEWRAAKQWRDTDGY